MLYDPEYLSNSYIYEELQTKLSSYRIEPNIIYDNTS
uniref:Uncharacterized protein n=1 Tax=Bombyx mori TaxID=7091 RepID=Q86QT6_BOMMO|nr:unknown [Bombyx mori]